MRLNTALKSLDQSPVSESKLKRSNKYSREKLLKVSMALKTSFEAVYNRQNEGLENAGEEMIRQLKEKFQTCSKKSDKIRVLSVLPKSWTIQRIQSKFSTVNSFEG